MTHSVSFPRLNPWMTGLIAALALVALLPMPNSVAAQTPAAGEPLQVVASFSILGDLVQDVGGDAVQVTTLIGPGVDAHTYDPAPTDLVVLEGAALVFQNGLGFEPWLDRFYESAHPSGTRVVVTDGITPRTIEANETGPGAQEHGRVDPHVWHDVANAIVMVENIRDALVSADPAHAAVYEANASSTIARFQTLDGWIRQQVATLPPERRKLVTSHDTFGYFAAAYGFQILGTALGSLSTEVGDPSARAIGQLVEEIQAAGVPAIFAENVANPDLMAAIAAEAGVRLAPTLYTDALGPPGSPGATYEGMIRNNVTTIVDALKG
jgi:zinc/manganese transport system substrate-binding protein